MAIYLWFFDSSFKNNTIIIKDCARCRVITGSRSDVSVDYINPGTAVFPRGVFYLTLNQGALPYLSFAVFLSLAFSKLQEVFT